MNATIRCGACGKALGSGETIHVAGEGPRCYPCFNRETADRLGLVFAEPQFQPVVLGTPTVLRMFTFRSMLVPTGLEIEAVEVTEGQRDGYRFAVLGHFEADVWELFQLLYAKMRLEIAPPQPQVLRRFDRKPKRFASRRLFLLQGLPGVGPALARRLLGQFDSVQGVSRPTR